MPSQIDLAIQRRQRRTRMVHLAEREEALESLLREALEWLDDYDLRLSGSASLADRIRKEIDREDCAP